MTSSTPKTDAFLTTLDHYLEKIDQLEEENKKLVAQVTYLTTSRTNYMDESKILQSKVLCVQAEKDYFEEAFNKSSDVLKNKEVELDYALLDNKKLNRIIANHEDSIAILRNTNVSLGNEATRHCNDRLKLKNKYEFVMFFVWVLGIITFVFSGTWFLRHLAFIW